jgi:predicted N-formylglutamate amidohydrolase
VDPNRSPTSAELYSEFTRSLSVIERSRILRLYYRRHRDAVDRLLRPWIARGDPVVHVGVHSFTPVWKGKRREVEVGILFDPDRSREQRFARRWIEEVRRDLPDLVVRPNEPYRGIADGLTTDLRQSLPPRQYLGIELEVSQRLATASAEARGRVYDGLLESLRRALGAIDLS